MIKISAMLIMLCILSGSMGAEEDPETLSVIFIEGDNFTALGAQYVPELDRWVVGIGNISEVSSLDYFISNENGTIVLEKSKGKFRQEARLPLPL